MTSSSVQVTPGLFAANREVAVAYYKGLQSHHANHQFMLGELASHAEKEDNKQKVTVIIALQTKVTEVTLEAQTKEERDEYQEKFYATDSVNAELRDGIKIKLGLRK
ncbi:hypothetical protein PTNB73_08397 [Pyrenophora teres f. teres]|nr:hypothetical protein HRS9139_08506 [Pyrenophora teres f. teres]KAE8844026.1 hypothetical protein HRS9122_05129 [Pyrenophora teres f. teres]KAE8858917.1 hypothetical protein PTNB73_08397 [Pyrenophora teres f. teres]